MKHFKWPGRPRMSLAGLLVMLFLEWGCASHRENSQFREAERANEMASSREERRKQLEEMSPWDRERLQQDERYYDESRRP